MVMYHFVVDKEKVFSDIRHILRELNPLPSIFCLGSLGLLDPKSLPHQGCLKVIVCIKFG